MRRATKKPHFFGHLSSNNSTGLTLLELMTVLIILSIMSVQSMPAFSGWINSWRLRSASDQFFQSLAMARNEAIKRNMRTVVCRSETGVRCDAAGNWQYGWIVFGDANGNAQLDTGDEIIFRQAALAEKMRFSGNAKRVCKILCKRKIHRRLRPACP